MLGDKDRKEDLGEAGPAMDTQACPRAPLLPHPTQDRAETWSRVSGWLGAKPRPPAEPGTQGPACQGRAGPKISKACFPPAARPAPCRGPGSGWTSPTGLEQRPFPRAPDFRSWPPLRPHPPPRSADPSAPSPVTPSPQASKRVHLSLLQARSYVVTGGGSHAPRLASRSSPA